MTEGPYKLPEGWRWVRLGEVADVAYGKANPGGSGTVPVVGSGGIYSYTSQPLVDYPTVVIGRKGTAGEARFIEQPCWPSDTTFFLRWKKEIEPRWVAFWFGISKPSPTGTSATLPSIRRQDLKDHPIPLPPLDEQRRIVARIEELIERVREAKRLRQQAKEDAERLWQSTLAETFPRPGAEPPPGWRWVRLGEVCLPTERRDPTKDSSAPFIYVDISAVDNAEGKIVSPRELLGQDAPSRARKVIHSGDVIFATTRPYLKKVAIVGPEIDGQICSTGFCVLRANRRVVEPGFLFYLCRSDLVVAQLSDNNMRGASYPAVTDRDVYEALIPLPPLDEQRRIVAHLEALREKIKILKEIQATTDAELQRLEQAILDSAFRGEL